MGSRTRVDRGVTFEGFTVVDAQADGLGATSRLCLEVASPFLSGHFPSEPIFPGVAHLGLAVEAAAKLEQRPVFVTGLRDFRLRQVVRPGEVIDVRVTRASGQGEIRFEIRKGELVASSGILTVSALPSHE